MNTKALRQKVLDLAIHGKLVPQNPNDESATVLLEKIRAEKAEKIKKGELKADKKDSFIFVGSDKRHYEQFADGTVKDIEDEIPFEVPEVWAWCRLGELFYHTTGKALKKSNNKGSLRKYITTSNLYWNKFDFTEVREMYFTDDELDKCTITKGDLVLCNGGDVGRAAIWNFDEEICYQNHVSRLRPKITEINNKLYLYLLMFYKEQGMLNGKGVGITSLSANDLLSGLFPVPPINEQNQIVIKIENIFSQIDYIDENKADLQTAIKQTKSKILDLAIHGKLVPQDSNDEPAEELLKRIATSDNRPYEKVEEDPFEIPDSWKWVKLGDIGQTNIGLTYHPNDISNTGITVLRSNNIQNDKLCFDDVVKVNPNTKILNNQYINNGDILICARNGSQSLVGKCVLINNLREKTSFGAFMAVFRSHCNQYILKYLQSKYFKDYMFESNSTQIHQLTQSMLKDALIPFPPENEQARIVSKIDELYFQLDQIQNNLV